MNTTDSQQIVQRFFSALQLLKENKMIRGKKTFTSRYGINRWNLNTLQRDPSAGTFQVAWLHYLVRDYNMSALWLLTGEGKPFRDNSTATPHPCRR